MSIGDPIVVFLLAVIVGMLFGGPLGTLVFYWWKGRRKR